jgi:hypothetical protein
MLTPSPDSFTAVARAIAKGPPPKWLALGLAHFSSFVGTNPAPRRFPIAHVHDAASTLIKFLPAYLHLPAGMYIDADVPTTIAVLRRVKADLARLMKRKRKGRPPNVQRRECARVVIEAWSLIRGDVEPRSIELLNACNDYWRACGHDTRGEDVENWRRDVRYVIRHPHPLIRQRFTALRDGT